MLKNQKIIPAQLEICFSEKCNLDCDYCFVTKTSPYILTITKLKKAVDIFLSMSQTEKTVTFNTSEPFLHPELFIESINYIFKKADELKVKLKIVVTTNGIFFDSRMQQFVASLDERFTLNLSLDGERDSHDAHRKIVGGGSSFEKGMINFEKFAEKENVRVISTIAPDVAKYVGRNINFIFGKKFNKIDIFPQLFKLWSEDNLKELAVEMTKLINRVNLDKGNRDLRLLNRLWGATDYASILLGSDGKFYLFEWVLSLKYEKRTPYLIGDVNKINLEKRQALFGLLFEIVKQKTNNKCATCEQCSFCSNPIPLYLWCLDNKQDFGVYFENFCKLARVMIKLSEKLKNKNKLDLKKWKQAVDLLEK
jgi:sulfatase maturation enzyme AslB (radical SAM superfamily)